MNFGWEDLATQQERVKWARIRWFNSIGAVDNTARAAAASLGMKEDTYSAYERSPDKSKSSNLDIESARKFGKKFKVNWLWLLLNEGTPFDEPVIEPVLKINNVLKNASPEEQAAAVDIIERLFGNKKAG